MKCVSAFRQVSERSITVTMGYIERFGLFVIIISRSIQHNLPRMMKNQTYSVRMAQLVQGTMTEASFTSTP